MLRSRQIDFFLCQRTWFAATLLWWNGVPASHTGICQTLARRVSKPDAAGRPGGDCVETPDSPPRTLLGPVSPMGPYLQLKSSAAKSESKGKLKGRRKPGKNLSLGGMGCSGNEGPAHWCGGSQGGFKLWDMAADLWPEGHLDVSLPKA